MKKENINILSNAENYFILLLFCRSRFLLGKECRSLYDALFEKYKKVYKEEKRKHIDLKNINDKFIEEL